MKSAKQDGRRLKRVGNIKKLIIVLLFLEISVTASAQVPSNWVPAEMPFENAYKLTLSLCQGWGMGRVNYMAVESQKLFTSLITAPTGGLRGAYTKSWITAETEIFLQSKGYLAGVETCFPGNLNAQMSFDQLMRFDDRLASTLSISVAVALSKFILAIGVGAGLFTEATTIGWQTLRFLASIPVAYTVYQSPADMPRITDVTKSVLHLKAMLSDPTLTPETRSETQKELDVVMAPYKNMSPVVKD